MSFGKDDVPSVVRNQLIAAKWILFGPSGRTARDVRIRLIIAEAGKCGIFTGEVVVQPDGGVTLVQSPHWNVGIVRTSREVRSAARWIQGDHRQSNRIG